MYENRKETREEVTKLVTEYLIGMGELLRLAREEVRDGPEDFGKTPAFRGLPDWHPYAIQITTWVFTEQSTTTEAAAHFKGEESKFELASVTSLRYHFTALSKMCEEQAERCYEIRRMYEDLPDSSVDEDSGVLSLVDEEATDYRMNEDAADCWIQINRFQIHIENNDHSVGVSILPYRQPDESNGYESGAMMESLDSAYASNEDVDAAFERED